MPAFVNKEPMEQLHHKTVQLPTTHPSGDPRFATLDEVINNYHHEPTALIQVLHAAQQMFGYLSADVSNLFARIIYRLHYNRSLSSLLDDRSVIKDLLKRS